MERPRRNDGEMRLRQIVVGRYRLGKRAYWEERLVYLGPQIINPLPKEKVVSTAQQLISGKSFDFTSKEATQDYWMRIGEKSFPFTRMVATIIRDQGTESRKACSELTDDLRRFSPDKPFLNDDPNLLKEWLFKLTLGVYAHPYVGFELYKSRGLVSPEVRRYYDETERQINKFKQTLAHLRKEDLPLYIRFEDMFHFYGTKGLFSTGVSGSSGEGADANLLRAVKDKEETLRQSLLDQDASTWQRLRIGWGAKQIQECLSMLPSIRSRAVMHNLVCILDESISDFSQKATSLDGSEELKIDPDGVIELLKWKYELADSHKNDFFAKMYPRIASKLEKNLEFTNFSVPIRQLPHTAISLLSESAKRNNKAEFTDLIKDINSLTIGKNVNVPWFITLLVLKASHPEMSEEIEQAVSGLDSLPIGTREVFLNKRAGKLWLAEDGKLRVTDTNTLLLSAFPIYTSSKLPDEVIAGQQEKPKKEETEKPEAKAMVVSETSNVPFFEEIGRPEDIDVKDIIDLMFKEQADLDEDALLNDFEHLAEEWKARNESLEGRDLLFVPYLNRSDNELSRAYRYGVEGIYIKGEETTLILNRNVAVGSSDNRTLSLGLRGKIDNSGMFTIDGMDEFFVGEKEHVFLNNLVLYLALQPLFNESGIPEETDKNMIRATNDAVSSWNRSTFRGSLPKIDRNADRLNLPIRIAGYKEPVLVGEKLK